MKYLLFAIIVILGLTNIALSNELMVVSAAWCNPCQQLKAYLKSNQPNLKIIYVDFDKDKETVSRLKVSKVPTSFIFDDSGKIISKKIGYDNNYGEWLRQHE